MKTKRVSWLLAITCLLPWVAWAEGDNDTEGLALAATADRCRATFSVSDQTLTLPCVEVVMGNETVLYSAQLQQVAEGRFALTQVAELSAAVESDCVASYSLETGELGVPCVEEVNPPGLPDYRQLILHADKSDLPSLFRLDSLNLEVSNGASEKRHTRASSNSCDNPQSLPKYRVDAVPGYTNVYAVAVYLCAGAKIVPFVGTRTKVGDKEWGGCNGVTGKKPYYSFPAGNVKAFTTNTNYSEVGNGLVAISGSFHNSGYVNKLYTGVFMPSYPIMVSGTVSTYGADPCGHSSSLSLLTLRVNETQKRAVIKPFDMAEFENAQSGKTTDVYSIITGLSPQENIDSTSKRGRNFVCAKNPYKGGFGTLVFLIGREPTLTQKEATSILTSTSGGYGCTSDQVMMLDGSTVAQLSYKPTGSSSSWTHAISESRLMPQIFVVK